MGDQVVCVLYNGAIFNGLEQHA